jgi:hypothetical protein
MSDIRIPAPVIIQEALDERTWKATLPNGKVITVYHTHFSGLPRPSPGDRCTVHLSLCDFDHGKIVAVEGVKGAASMTN